MNNHKNARLTPHGRALLVRRVLEEGLRPVEAAQAMGVSRRTVYKWLRRFREEGAAGLQNRSSRPQCCPHQTPTGQVSEVIQRRRRRQTYRQIALGLSLSQSTVARILKRAGLNRLAYLDPPKPANRYEYPVPGDLLHLDIKKLGRFRRPGHRVTGDRRNKPKRGPGWEYVHIAIDDHSRVATSSIHADESAVSACKALIHALRYYKTLGIRFRRVLTDNGSAYRSRRFKRVCQRLGLRHLRTKPYHPRTNGKAERFIQTALREWAYARSYPSSEHRAQQLLDWLHQYNWHRPHASLDYQPPITRIPINENNLVALHI
jgi:transposase InsO family protein